MAELTVDPSQVHTIEVDPSQVAPHANDEAPSKRTVGGFIGNVFNSGGRLVRDVVGATTHPGATLQGVTGLLQGMAEKSGFKPAAGVSHEQNVDALINLYKNRYGSVENFAKTLYEDPVGVMADVATLAGASGLAARGVEAGAKVAGLTRTADTVGKVADVAGTVASTTDPMGLIGKGTMATARAVLPSAEKLYLSALKAPPSWYTPEEAAQIARTGIGEKVLVSEGGLQRLYGLIDDVNQKIKATIQRGAASGVAIDPQKVALRTKDIEAKFGRQVNPIDDLNAIKASREEFLDQNSKFAPYTNLQPNPYASPGSPGQFVGAGGGQTRIPQPIPADEAQALKQGTYAQLKDKAFGELKSASIEAQKSLARGLKEELATAFPEIATMNARDSRLIMLENALERSVRRIGNHQLFGIGTPIAAAGVGAATGSAKAAAIFGVMRAAVDNPQVKSALAIILGSAKNPAGQKTATTATTLSRVQSYLDALGQASTVDAAQIAPAITPQ